MAVIAAYLGGMDRLVRIMFAVAALSIGWAPVARANSIADHLMLGAHAVHRGHAAAHAGHHAGSGDRRAPAADSTKPGILHPGHCPACIAVPPLPRVPAAFGLAAAPAVYSDGILVLWRGAPEPPPPRP